jgi:acyl dehydratase
MQTDLASLDVGAELPAQTFGPVTRTVLALFAGGSGDHNPIHIDTDFAMRAGMPDVLAHGMLSMAYLAQYVLSHATPNRLRSWSVRFTAITPVNANVTCSGRIVARDEKRGEITLALTALIDDGTETVAGQALISI